MTSRVMQELTFFHVAVLSKEMRIIGIVDLRVNLIKLIANAPDADLCISYIGFLSYIRMFTGMME